MKALTTEQRAKSDERKERFASLAKQIAAMSDAQRNELAAKIDVHTVEGRSLSLRNTLLIAMQCQSATLVGGFRQWIKAGRAVRKGEHGISILVPSTYKAKDTTTGVEVDGVRFLSGVVFDVSQTDEIEVPAMA